MSFSAWSYADQVKKYYPKEAHIILNQATWLNLPRVRAKYSQTVICRGCGEEFIATNGRQKYCFKNSQGINCSKVNKHEKKKNLLQRLRSQEKSMETV